MTNNKELKAIIFTLIGQETFKNNMEKWTNFLKDEIPFDNNNFEEKILGNFPEIIKKYKNKLVYDTIMKKIDYWQKIEINFLLLGNGNYPASLRNIYQPPTILFYRGNWKNDYDFNRSVAIVGSRKAEITQAKFVQELSCALCENNLCVVSGLALGIDASAHSGAIQAQNDFPTIAVLGNGLEKIYPACHEYLASQIIEKGGIVLSQFAPSTPPLPYNFLDRNRVITGLSRIVIVAQAALKSGALSSARHALEQGRDLLSIVGPVYNEYFEGSNKLIVDGASPIATIKDFFKYYPELQINKKISKKISAPTNQNEKLIFDYIKNKNKVSKLELQKNFKELDLPLILLNLESDNYIFSEPFGEGGATFFVQN